MATGTYTIGFDVAKDISKEDRVKLMAKERLGRLFLLGNTSRNKHKRLCASLTTITMNGCRAEVEAEEREARRKQQQQFRSMPGSARRGMQREQRRAA